jgi:hypothetical protein
MRKRGDTRRKSPAESDRQWVLSFPRQLRFRAARDPKVASRPLDIFTRALFAWQGRSSRRLGTAEARTAGVTAVQRFGGVPPPSDEEVSRILVKVIRKVTRQLGPPGDDDGAAANAFAALQAQEVDRRIRIPDPFKHARRPASLDGYSLHAGVRIHDNDREGLERLCRYAFRPPFALERLTLRRGGAARLQDEAAEERRPLPLSVNMAG